MMAHYGIAPSVSIILLPLCFLSALSGALTVGLWLSALNVEFRDVRYLIPFLAHLWLFVTPIAYPGRLLCDPWHTLYGLSPMAGVAKAFAGRSCAAGVAL